MKMNKQELIKKYEGEFSFIGMNLSTAIKFKELWVDILELDEPQKVTVPQFVADWIEKVKKELSLREAMSQGYAPHEIDSWLREMDQDGACLNQETFARAWLDGYEVKEEKQYEAILCNGQSLKTVYRQGEDHLDFEKVYGDLERFTRKQLEDAGFGWMFDCPGIEVREVE